MAEKVTPPPKPVEVRRVERLPPFMPPPEIVPRVEPWIRRLPPERREEVEKLRKELEEVEKEASSLSSRLAELMRKRAEILSRIRALGVQHHLQP